VLTHLHNDHIGWNADAEGAPCFSRARYLAHGDALAYARTRTHLPHIARCVTGIADRFDAVVDGQEIVPGVRIVALPGHHPGHIGLRVGFERPEAIILGDAAPNPALLDAPDLRFTADHDSDRTIATGRRPASELRGTDTVVVCGHYPHGGIGRVVSEDGRTVWRPIGH
jgi:glyoxylase-like metal-dependent hydrolase (beta-lactamase superfamily II)